ncbi:Uncharacterized protein NEOC95_000574 [Neochlamydia sp. AcF95]|nr:Uncharacterized protein [Neochlamydia sp. AcF95]
MAVCCSLLKFLSFSSYPRMAAGTSFFAVLYEMLAFSARKG